MTMALRLYDATSVLLVPFVFGLLQRRGGGNLHMRTRDDVGWKMGAVIQQSVGGRTTTLLIRLDDGVLGG